MNPYYDVSIKEYRLKQIEDLAAEHTDASWRFIKGSIADKAVIEFIFNEEKPDIVVNLATQAGGGVGILLRTRMCILNPT